MTVEVGSRWYVFGHHWEVLEEGERDGQPAVLVRCLTGKNPRKVWGKLFVRALERHGRPSEGTLRRNGTPTGREKPGPKGGAVTTTATEKKQSDKPAEAAKEKEPPPSVDELRAEMAKHQKGYDAYCKLRDEMKGLSDAKKKPLLEKQEKHKAAFKAWKKAYNGMLKQGVSLRQLRAEAKAAAEAEKKTAEPEPQAAS